MNRLQPPDIDDNGALTRLANNRRVRSFPYLRLELAPIIAGYEQYRVVLGDAHQIANVQLSDEVRAYLKAHYNSPPADLAYITNLRLDAEQRVCPMCGSMHRGTLDHLMPKEAYTAFAVFSLNLVPACKCNSRRGEITVGPAAGERILHPYFDDCLSERLVGARFDDLGPIPRISLQLLTPPAHPKHRAIEFHVRHIVSNTAILKHLSDKWAHLCERPQRIVRALAEIPQSEQALRDLLEMERELTDEAHGGKNNWDSVFVTGLLDADVLDWLYTQLSRPGREPDAPLLAP